MKILALDLGDKWTGTAISDALRMLARPLETIETKDLHTFLTNILAQERISIIVAGHPQTLKGTNSAQTTKIEKQVNELTEQFPHVQWVLWDERLTSDQASELMRGKKFTKENKRYEHSVAAALILGSYLDYLRIGIEPEEFEEDVE
jgi:putative Holliday junction resolvase